MRAVIITADDLGMSPDINRASLAAATEGLVRSVDVMPPAPHFRDAVELMQRHPAVDVGVHFTVLAEFEHARWSPLLPRDKIPSLYRSDGTCHADVEELARHMRPSDLALEIEAQVRAVLDAGLRPTHLSQHMFAIDELADRIPDVGLILRDIAANFGLALRITHPPLARTLKEAGIRVVDRVPTNTHDVPKEEKLAEYSRILKEAPEGVTELIVHCAFASDSMRALTKSADRRQGDYDVVLSGELRRIVSEEDIALVDWSFVRGA